MRLHPAESRVLRLAAETPAAFVLFDCLMDADGQSLADAPLTRRRAALETLFGASERLSTSGFLPGRKTSARPGCG